MHSGPRSFRRVVRRLALLVALVACGAAATAQRFTQPSVIPTGNWPAGVYSADINADGKPDLIYIDHGATGAASITHILLNDGHGAFHQSATLATAGDSVAIGDLLGHGRIDIGWVSATSPPNVVVTIHTAPGNGDGTFGTQVTADITGTSFYNGANKTPLWHYLQADPDRGLGQPVDIFVQESVIEACVPYSVIYPVSKGSCGNISDIGVGPAIFQDVNGDGFPDVLIQSATTDVARLFTFKTAPSPAFEVDGTHSVLLADMDGDGKLDILSEDDNGSLQVYLGNGDGTFTSTPTIVPGAQSAATGAGGHLIAVADLNRDGHPDILTATPAGISVLLAQPPLNGHTQVLTYTLKGIYNAGPGGFGSTGGNPTPGHASYALADFNGDGPLDLAVDSPEGIAILYGNNDGSFQTSQSFAAGQPALSGAVGVFTTSGNFDAVVATSDTQGQFLRGAGDGTFAYLGSPAAPTPTTTVAATPGLWSNLQVADFDKDGKLDLVFTADGSTAAIANRTLGGMRFQKGNGDGTFQVPQHVPTNSSNCTLPNLLYGNTTVADFDGDGTLQLLNRDSGSLRLAYSRTGQTPTFINNNIRDSDCSQLHEFAVPGRFTGQALPDVISQHLGSLLLFQTDSAGDLYDYGAGSTPVPLGDLAVDGSLTTPGQRTAPDLSATYGGMSTALGFPAVIGSMTTADLDRDGNPDLIVAYANLSADPTAPTGATANAIYIWFGSGNGKFLTSAAHPVNPVVLRPMRNFYQVLATDINGDGIPDLVLSDGYLVSVMPGDTVGDGTYGPEIHYLAGQGINSISVADVNHDGHLDLVIANGGAVFSNPAINHETLATNPQVNTGGITVLLGSNALITPTGTLTASPNPATYSSAFTLTATLNPTATGTVTFSIDGVAVSGAIALSGGAASYTVSAPTYKVGTHTLSAAYSGDTVYTAATLSGSEQITGLPSSTSINNVTSILYYGLDIDGQGSVVGNDPNDNSGTITFFIDGVNVCVLPVNPIIPGQVNSCPSYVGSGYNAGNHTINAVFSGDDEYAGSSSPIYPVQILRDDTTTSLSSLLNPSVFGQSVTFSAQVIAPYATPTGSVAFYDGATLLGSGTLTSSGTATYTTSALAVGTHPITAVYGLTQNFNPSTSAVVQQTVTQPAFSTSTVLASSLNPSIFGQSVTFSVAVATTVTSTTIPAGTVTFLDGATVLGTATLNGSGMASYATSALAVGSHPITAVYTGNAATATSTSNTVTQIVNAAPSGNGFTLTVNPSALSVPIGSSLSVLVTVTPIGAFSQPVALSCSGLPEESACTFGLATIPAGGGSTRMTVNATAPHTCGTTTPYFIASGPSSLLEAFATVLLLLLVRRKRTLAKGIVLALALLVLSSSTGCGNCTDLGVRPGTYSFHVTGVSTGSPAITVSQTAQMIAHL